MFSTIQIYARFQCITSNGMILPAENAANENNLDPKDWTENIDTMKNQIKEIRIIFRLVM